MALSEVIQVRLSYAFIHPFEGDTEVMREVAKVLFNIRNPSFVVINLVKANIPIPLFYAPHIRGP